MDVSYSSLMQNSMYFLITMTKRLSVNMTCAHKCVPVVHAWQSVVKQVPKCTFTKMVMQVLVLTDKGTTLHQGGTPQNSLHSGLVQHAAPSQAVHTL